MNTQLNFDREELSLENMLKRFIKYSNENRLNSDNTIDKVVSLAEFKKDRVTKDPVEEHLNQLSLMMVESMLEIIQAKVRMITGVDIIEDECGMDFDDIMSNFKTSVETAEEIFRNENLNIYETPQFTPIDAITSIAADRIITIYFKNPEVEKEKE